MVRIYTKVVDEVKHEFKSGLIPTDQLEQEQRELEAEALELDGPVLLVD